MVDWDDTGRGLQILGSTETYERQVRRRWKDSLGFRGLDGFPAVGSGVVFFGQSQLIKGNF